MSTVDLEIQLLTWSQFSIQAISCLQFSIYTTTNQWTVQCAPKVYGKTVSGFEDAL